MGICKEHIYIIHIYIHIHIVLGGMFMVVRKLKTKHFLFPHPFQQVSTQISKHTDCERSLYAVLENVVPYLYYLFILLEERLV